MPRNIHNKLLIAVTISISVALAGVPLAAGAAARPATSAAGQVSPRASVPWRRVGPGWELTQYWPGRFQSIKKAIAAPVTLYLISPAGHRYQLYRWAATTKPPSLIDWSGDKARALIYLPITGRLEQLALATGRVSRISPPSQVATIGYTRPAGQGLLAIRHAGARVQLLRLSLAGQLVKVLASGARDAVAVYSSSGTTIAVAGARGLQLVSTNGGVIRGLPVPRTDSSGCLPTRWWNARTILATCVAGGAHRDRLWLVPASGARPRPLTPQHGPHSPDPGDLDAWTTPGGLYLQGINSDGRALIFRQRANGALRPIKIAGSANDNWIAGARGSRLLISETSLCGQSDSLLWFSPATGGEQMLLKAPRGRAGTTGVVPYGPPFSDVQVEGACPGGAATRDVSGPGATGVAPGLLRRS
jgi:hypothetical protein